MTARRIVAALIDIAVLGVVFAIMAFTLGRDEVVTQELGGGTSKSYRVGLYGWDFGLYLLIVLAYYTATETIWRATPGKLALGLRVASADLSPLTPGRMVLRNVLRVIDSLPVFYLVGIIAIAASQRDQRLGDLAVGTIVVRDAPSVPHDAEADTAPEAV